MAKLSKSSSQGTKEVFGKKKEGKPKRKYGPKEHKPKVYRGQGR